MSDNDLYAAYANHCAIQKKLAMTFHSWKREAKNAMSARDGLRELIAKAESERVRQLSLYEANRIEFPDIAAAHKVFADRACGELDAYHKVEAALAADAPEQADCTLVPNSALHWLFGEEGDFVPEIPSQSANRYWWRAEFRRRIALAQDKVGRLTGASLARLLDSFAARNSPTCHKCGRLVETGDIFCSEHELEIIKSFAAQARLEEHKRGCRLPIGRCIRCLELGDTATWDS